MYKLIGINDEFINERLKSSNTAQFVVPMLRSVLTKLTFPLIVDVAEPDPQAAVIVRVNIPLGFPHNIWALSWFIHEKID